MILRDLKLAAAAIILVGAVYFAWSWYNSTRFGPGESSAIWVPAGFIAPDALTLDGAMPVTRILANPQGLKDTDFSGFLHSSQGSLMVPDDIFLALESASGTGLFVAPGNLRRLRYVAGAAGQENPDALPIGFSRSTLPWQGETYVGLSCAACHSGVVTYRGTGLFIMGAPTQGDFQTMTEELDAALVATLEDPARFDRMAQRLNVDGDAARLQLRDRLVREQGLLGARVALNAAPLRYGYGRVDAVGQIYNMATSVNLGLPQNAAPPDAPVSYPQIWGTGQSDVAQWTGFAPNWVPGSILLRNVGEVIGVFGRLDARPGSLTYPSSIDIADLGALEDWVNQLEPPAWPEQILGAIDRDLAAQGEALYATHCSGCHEIRAARESYEARLISPDELGVDPLAARNAIATGETRDGARKLKLKMLIEQAMQVAAAQPDASVRAIERGAVLAGFGKRGGFTYKARPLNGIWATAPYLHNGSVPTLFDMLTPPAERPRELHLGGWEFDPVRVGFAPYTGVDAWVLDTALPGNRNTGHDAAIFGTTFSEAQRWAIVEYLKTL